MMRFNRRILLVGFLALLVDGQGRECISLPSINRQSVYAQSQSKQAKSNSNERSATADDGGRPRDYKSDHFLVHTDLSAEDAEELLKRLETMLGLISKYWGRPCRQVIECFVVDDLENWPRDAFPEQARQNLEQGGGITMTTVAVRGEEFLAKSLVYAVADRGTPQHEAVHAFCAQTFGTTGPVWYSEGMAEMGNYWKENDRSVNCHEGVIRYIRESEPKSLNEIVNSQEKTGDSWQNYAWRWALCHLLENNPNYRERFRPLGLGLLTKQRVSFESVYGSMAEEISFEYLFFLQKLEAGYRVDLCAWDWKAKFKPLRGTRAQQVKVLAGRGWQPTRVNADLEQSYICEATGEWSLSADGDKLTAAGTSDGAGRLVGVILDDDYQLSDEFDVGMQQAFQVPVAGKLYFRCRDRWGELADNKGQVTVKLKLADRAVSSTNDSEKSPSTDAN